MKIIGLSGTMGVGKDYICENYIRSHGFYRWALADHIKVFAIGKGLLTYDEAFHIKTGNIRDILQKEGTELGRDVYGDDVWVHTTFAWLRLISDVWNIHRFCIPDVRFENEVKEIQNRGGVVYRIVGDRSRENDTDLLVHRSEASLTDDLDIYDGVIENYSSIPERVLSVNISTLVYRYINKEKY